MTREEQARQYAKRIRNQGKRLYAEAYLGYLLGKRNEPDEKDYGISSMAAQAVQMELRDIIKPSISQPIPEPVKGEQAGMLGVPGKYVEQKRPWTPGQMGFESYAKYVEAMDRGYTLAELQQMCREKGLSVSGDKKTLIRRLF